MKESGPKALEGVHRECSARDHLRRRLTTEKSVVDDLSAKMARLHLPMKTDSNASSAC